MLNSPRRAIEAMRHSKYIYHSQGGETTSSTVIAFYTLYKVDQILTLP